MSRRFERSSLFAKGARRANDDVIVIGGASSSSQTSADDTTPVSTAKQTLSLLADSGLDHTAQNDDDAVDGNVGEETRKQKIIKWLKRFGLVFIGLFALFQGLGAGVNKAAAVLKAFPSIATVNLIGAQIAVSILAILGTFMNFYIMVKELPDTVKNLYAFFKDFKENWNKSKVRSVLTIVAIVAALCAGAATAAFTFYSAPITIIGMMSLFGATAFPPLFAIAIVLAIVQGIAISALLFNSAQRLIYSINMEKVKRFFTFKWWPRAGQLDHTEACYHEKNQHIKKHGADDHYQCQCHNLAYRRAIVISKALAILIGGAILVGAAIFSTIIEGDAFMVLLKDMHQALAYALTVGIIYVATGVLQGILNINSANSVFGLFGRKLGAGCYHVYQALRHPIETLSKWKAGIKASWAATKAEAKANPGEFAWKVFKNVVLFGWAVFLVIAVIGNATGNAAMGSHGVHGDNVHNQTADKITASLQPDNPQPELLRSYLTTPQGSSMNAAQYAATAVVGLESAAIISHVLVTHSNPEKGTEMRVFNRARRGQYNGTADENTGLLAGENNDDEGSARQNYGGTLFAGGNATSTGGSARSSLRDSGDDASALVSSDVAPSISYSTDAEAAIAQY